VSNKKNILTNIKLRIISATMIFVAFMFGILYSKYFFTLLMLIVLIGMIFEWYSITKSSKYDLLIGCFIFPISCGSLILIRFIESSYIILLTYFIIIWTVDTMALVGGKSIGGIKLAPSISPKKTWSGLIVGSVSSGLAASLLTYLPDYNYEIFAKFGINSFFNIFIFGFLLGIISQVSDLFMSFFKRKFHVKDSGNIIPGHGGMIDRFDSIVLTAPIILYFVL
jgi:phosphatidate cytidylyltransferase